MFLENNNYKVNIEVDTTYTVKSTDNRNYDLIFQVEDYPRGHMYKAFSITVICKELEYCIALVGSCFSEVYHCAVLNDNELVVLMNNDIIFIDLKNINILRNMLISDFGTCFAIYKFKDGYVIHGELEVIKLDSRGKIEWKFSGGDIFVTSKMDNFSALEDEIIVEDWQGYTYHINENGLEVK